MITEQVITGVTRKNVQKKDGSSMVLFEIETGDGTTWTTAKESLALDAHSRVGILTAIDGTIKENAGTDRNGNARTYTNHYLNALGDSGELGVTITDPRAVGNNIPERITYSEDPSDRQESIYRQVAAKVAATMSGTSEEFWQNVIVLMEFFRTGTMPSSDFDNKFIPQQGERIPVAAGSSFNDDDIPF